MRSQDEIVKRIRETKDTDFFGFGQEVLLQALDFEHAKEFIKPEVTKEIWNEVFSTYTDENLKKMASEYLEFAWDKAEDHRGLSASRSVQKMTEFVWLLGMDDVVKKIGDASFTTYGAPILKIVAEALGTIIPASEALVNMMNGSPCSPSCDEGCNG